jgi:guanine nucleotide-binding protein G(i) subunit alpha
MLEQMPSLNLVLNPKNDTHRAVLLALPEFTGLESDDMPFYPRDVAEAMRSLWADNAVKEACRRGREINLGRHAVYFFDSLERLSSKDYVPTNQDIYRMSVKAGGAFEVSVDHNRVRYRLIHPRTGNRSQRKKGSPMFRVEDVHAFIFLADVSEYNLSLHENDSGVGPGNLLIEMFIHSRFQNRLQETLNLFDAVANSRALCDTSCVRNYIPPPICLTLFGQILILYGIDRLAEQFYSHPLRDYFPDYLGGDNYDAGCDYILYRFMSLFNYSQDRLLYAHYETSLFDTSTTTPQCR